MSKVYFGFLLALATTFVYSQNVNNVCLVDHREYMTEVLTQVGLILEDREWCNLNIPEFDMSVDQVVFNWEVNGTVSFQNGFVLSIERLEILESSLNQIWSWVTDDATGRVEVRGTLRMHNMIVGLDVVANFNGNVYRSSATYLHPLVTFDFSIFRNTQTLETTVTVAGTVIRSTNKLNFLPVNNATYVIRALYDTDSTTTGITSWANQVLQPVAEDVVMNSVPFPVVCYDCPIT